MADRSFLGNTPLLRSGDSMLYRQIYERVRKSVLDGKLRAGTRLPSARSLSDQLGVARGTVELAYQLLSSEGFTNPQGARGTIIAGPFRRPGRGKLGTTKGRQSAGSVPLRGHTSAESLYFKMGLPALDAFPRKLWARLSAHAARGVSTMDLAADDPAGHGPLRHAIAGYLQISRGIDCTPHQIVITAGYQGALSLIIRLLMSRGEPVWVEDPGYFRAHDALKLSGMKLIPVPIDKEGMDVSVITRRPGDGRFALVTPSHQFPTGVPLSMARRLALLDWAQSHGTWIIEDDYDSEFHYRGRPLPALKSLDEADRVLYIGTFSKVLFPGLRMGYLVAPRALSQRFAEVCALLHPAAGMVEQYLVRDFISEGHFTRHIRKTRRLYSERRTAVVAAIRRLCGDALSIELSAGGMHLVAYLASGASEKTIVARASKRGLTLAPLSITALHARTRPGLLMGFSNIPVRDSERAARLLQQVLSNRD